MYDTHIGDTCESAMLGIIL